jgi:hypothetical protein
MNERGIKRMEHEDKQPNQDNAPETQETQESQEMVPSPSNTAPTPSVDPVLANIRARFGLGNDHLPKDTSVQTLLSGLNDPDWRVRTAVARRLGSAGDGAEVRAALLSAVRDSAPAVRAAAARSLGGLDEDIPEEPLLYLLRNDTDEDVRTAAAQALSALQDRLSPYTVAGLEATFHRAGENDITRSAIIYTLGGLGKRTPIDLLYTAMQDREWLVREAAALMMGEQGERTDEEALEALASKEDEHPAVIQAAYQAIGNHFGYQDDQLARSEPFIQVVGNEEPARLSTQPIKLTYAQPQHVGNVEFDGIEPGSLNIEKRIPVVAQALDNQWVPRTLLEALLTGRVSLECVQDYLTGLARTEYLRSLINGEQIIMNRAFLYNNSVIARDYMQTGPSREVFKRLLSEGIIIPFLLYEKSPDQPPRFTTVPQNLAAWQQVCQETHMQCMRFSWHDEETNDEEVQRLSSGMHRFAQSDQLLNISRLVSDLGLPAEQEPALRTLLGDLHTWSYEFFQQTGKYVNREDIYNRYITSGDPAQRNYDGSKQFAGEIKQLFDVAYSNNLAEFLNGYLLTPVDSPTSLILQDWHSRREENKYLTTAQLVQMVRQKIFQIVQSGLYLRSIRMLRLQDIQAIRNTDEWRAYIESLQQLLKAPLEFADRANDVYQNYIKLAQVITRLIAIRDSLMGGSLTAEWRPNVKLIINVGGSATTVAWNSGEDKPYTDAAEQQSNLPKVMGGGRAPVNVRMIIGDSSSPSKLHTSIDIIQGRMHNARMQWLDLCDRLVKELYLREFSPAQAQSESLPNLNATAEITA